MEEIARKLDLNISTVSRALNRNRRISKATTELVLKTAEEVGYHMQHAKKCIVVLLPASRQILASYTMNLINALMRSLKRRNYYWEFINIDRIDLLRERSVTGIISIDYMEDIAKQVSEKYNIPLVCINDASDPSNNVCSVCSDPASAIFLSFNCLYDHGHRNIAFISTSGKSHAAHLRKDAFLKMVSECGLEGKSFYISDVVRTYHGTVCELSRKGITGIISDGESAGLQVFHSLNFCKLKIPQKMSLVSWEFPYVSDMVRPAVTTVEQNFPELAETALVNLESLIRGEPVPADTLIPYTLHLRDSVSVPRQ